MLVASILACVLGLAILHATGPASGLAALVLAKTCFMVPPLLMMWVERLEYRSFVIGIGLAHGSCFGLTTVMLGRVVARQPFYLFEVILTVLTVLAARRARRHAAGPRADEPVPAPDRPPA